MTSTIKVIYSNIICIFIYIFKLTTNEDRPLLFVLPATTNQLEAGQSNICGVYMTNGILIQMLVIHSKEDAEE